jgi:hypothetical protein
MVKSMSGIERVEQLTPFVLVACAIFYPHMSHSCQLIKIRSKMQNLPKTDETPKEDHL